MSTYSEKDRKSHVSSVHSAGAIRLAIVLAVVGTCLLTGGTLTSVRASGIRSLQGGYENSALQGRATLASRKFHRADRMIPDTEPPDVIISPSSATQPSAQLAVLIKYCDSQSLLNSSSRVITLNGVSVLSNFAYKDTTLAGCRKSSISRGSVTLPLGQSTLHASICDGSVQHWCSQDDAFYTNSTSSGDPETHVVDLTPDYQRLEAEQGQPITAGFTVQNRGSATETFTLQRACSGTAIVGGCSPAIDSVTLLPNEARVVLITSTATTGPDTVATLKLTVNSRADAGVRDSGKYDVRIPQRTSGVDVVSVNTGDVIARNQCLNFAVPGGASECASLRLVHAAPSVMTFSTVRAPVLIYNSDHATPTATVNALVTLPNDGTVPTQVATTLQVNGVVRATGTWSGSNWLANSTRRISLSYDASNDSTGRYSYTLIVQRTYAASTAADTVSGTLINVNRSQSVYGAGWWIAGLERLIPINVLTKLWIGGDGSARVYVSDAIGSSNTWRTTAVDHPDTIFLQNSEFVRRLPNGSEVRFGVNGLHMRTLNALGRETRFHYDSQQRLDSIIVPVPTGGSPRAFTLAYDATTQVLSEIRSTDGASGTRALVVASEAPRRIRSLRDPDNTTVMFEYDPTVARRIVARTDRRLTRVAYTYDAGGILTGSSLPLSATTFIVQTFRPRELLGRVGSTAVSPVSDYTLLDGPRTDVGDSSLFWTNRYGAPLRIRDALGNETLLERLDARWPGLVTRVQYADGRVSGAAYDANALLTQATDSSTYVDVGGVRKYATTLYAWDAKWSAVRKVTPPEGDSSSIVYDQTDGRRLLQQRGADTVRFGYTPQKQLSSVLYSNGARDSLAYDALGNHRYSRTPLGFSTNLTRDGLGRTTFIDGPVDVAGTKRLSTSTYYDASDNDTLTVSWGASDTLTVRKHYDAEANPDTISQKAGPDRNALGWVRRWFAYDPANRKSAEFGSPSPGGGAGTTIGFTYDLAGNLVSSDRGGTRRYDAANRMTFKIGTDTAAYTYDATGRLLTANNRTARISRRYLANGGLAGDTLRIVVADSTTRDFTKHVYGLEYGYDLSGRRNRLKYPGQFTSLETTYGYDFTSGALAWIVDQNALRYEYHYDILGRLDTLTRRAGTSTPLREVFKYDLDGRMITRMRYTGITEFGGDSLSYDARGKIANQYGRISGVFSPSDAMTYNELGYLTRGNLQSAGTDELYVVDAMGNRYSGSYTRGQGPRSERYYYDPNVARHIRTVINRGAAIPDTLEHSFNNATGDLLQERTASVSEYRASEGALGSAGTTTTNRYTTHSYDQESRLAEVIYSQPNVIDIYHGNTPTTYLTPERYRYDALGRRVWTRSIKPQLCSRVEPSSGCHSATTRTVWDGDQIAYEIRAEGSDTINIGELDRDNFTASFYGVIAYTHGTGIDEPLTVSQNGAVMHPFTNYRGAVYDAMCDSTACSPSSIRLPGRQSSPYGGILPTTQGPPSWWGSLIENQADASGLMYRRNRYYDPQSGRFTQEDPIGLAGGLNVYGYGDGDPISFHDPFGLWPCCTLPGAELAYGVNLARQIAPAEYTKAIQHERLRRSFNEVMPLVVGSTGGVGSAGEEAAALWQGGKAALRETLRTSSIEGVSGSQGLSLLGRLKKGPVDNISISARESGNIAAQFTRTIDGITEVVTRVYNRAGDQLSSVLRRYNSEGRQVY